MMKTFPLRLGVLGLGLVVLVGACDGDDDDGASPPSVDAGREDSDASGHHDAGRGDSDAGKRRDAAAAADDSDAGQDGKNEAPDDARYVVASIVDAPDGRTTYFNIAKSLGDETTLDFDDALEIAGNARLYGSNRLGWFALGGGEKPEITRYELTDYDAFDKGDTLSLANYGVASMGLAVAFADEHKAYYLDQGATQQLIVWDPTTMEITGSIDLPSLAPKKGEALYATMAQRGKQLLIFAGFTDWDAAKARPSSVFVIVDTDSDKVVSSSVVKGCSHATNFVRVPDGDIYVASEVDATLYHSADSTNGSAGCLLHLAAGADELDAKAIELADWTGTQISGGLVPGPDGSLIFQAYDEKVEPLTDDVLAAYGASAWRFWRWTPGQSDAELLEGDAQGVNNLLMIVDGAGYVTGPAADPDSGGSRLVATAAAGAPDPGLASPGFISNVVRVR